MAQAPRRTALSGPTLVRLLARLTQIDVPESGQSLSDRLSRWLGWTDAIALSTALSQSPPAIALDAPSAGKDAASLCARVRTALAQAIAGTGEAHGRRGAPAQVPSRGASMDATADYADFRQRYLALQQTMQMEIADLRARLRRMLSAQTPDMARLAVLDASLEQALDAQERNLLARVPTLLGTHFERLRDAERQRLADAHAPQNVASAPPGAWVDVFRRDMQSVLLAELEIRFQPVEGLLSALRTR
ncbi:conserved hypothethical protein (plasmid) [Ralstonia solanacearum CMR15]|nr:conserved hypothethical protein [Ralstonia solanacearum CMR15]